MKVSSIVALALVTTVSARAAIIQVNTAADLISDAGSCSLREAIIAANSNAPSGAAIGECPSGSSGSPDSILVPAGVYALTLVGVEDFYETIPAVGDLDITQSVTITGAGREDTVVDGAALSARVVHVALATGTFSASRLTIRNGSSSGDGGGIYVEDAQTISISDARINGNSADDGGGLAVDGAQAVVSLNRTIVENNEALYEGGGIRFNGGTLQILDSRISGNQTLSSTLGDGGGISFDGESLSVLRTSVAGNTAAVDGGGLFVGWGSAAVMDSSIHDNDAGDDGGGFYFYISDTQTLSNVTISGNAADDLGGGLVANGTAGITLTHVTLNSNSAATASAIYVGDPISLRNTIVSGTCDGSLVTSQGGNIESPGDNCGLTLASDQVAVSAAALALEPLAFAGGATRGHRPSPGSAAVNSASPIFCLSTDQRGVPRPQGPSCDTGSVERVSSELFRDGFDMGSTEAWSSHVP